jgi:hypothetical protein
VREIDAKPKEKEEQESGSQQESKRRPRTINAQRPPLLKPTQQVVEDINSTIESMTDNIQRRTNKKNVKPGSTSLMTNGQGEGSPLHDLSYVGVGTCSARSISCNREDFLYLEMSKEYENDDTRRGVGETNGMAGKGCLIFYAKDLAGKMHAILEPRGFYLENPPAKFRILGQQRMKHKGLCVTQDYDNAGMDILKCKRSDTILPLAEQGRLLLLKTFSYQPEEELIQRLTDYVQGLKRKNYFLPHVIALDELVSEGRTVLIMNEGKLKLENYERLLHWRFGHTNTKVLQAMDLIDKSHLNEDCYCCNQAEFKRAPFPKNEGSYVAVAESYWRIYFDGYGGQNSLGCKSYGGAKGGMIFVCPMSGSIIVKLYATMKDFPSILYQVLQQIESQGYVCRELLVDTYVVNLSEAAEEVASMFRTRIVPISAGTPQELAYGERAVRTIAEKSRAMLLGAPHLPKSMWDLADLNAAYVYDVLPQLERKNKSPYEIRLARKPDVENLHIKVFG